MLPRLALYLRLLRAEGYSGVRARLRARSTHARSLASYRPAGAAEIRALQVPLLNLLPVSRKLLLGGVQVQLAERLAAESHERPIGLLFPEAGAYRLECRGAGRRLRHDCGPLGAGPEPLVAALQRALEALGASAVHVENLAGFAPHGLLDAGTCLRALAGWRARGSGALVASLHDYAAFCPRPHQIERPVERFCGFARELERCERCLARVPQPPSLGRQRALASELLAGAQALVCPSTEMRARLLELFPAWQPERLHAIAPCSGARQAARVPHWPPRHVAIVGATRLEKGARAAADLVPRLKALGLTVSAHGGGGDAQALVALRRAGARQCGSYSPGSLPARLASVGADLAVLPTIGPETYSLALDECWAAGLPAVLFDVGAQAARVRAWGGGRLAPLDSGSSGLLEAVAALLGAAQAPLVPQDRLPTAQAAAEAHLALYTGLGLLPR